MRNSAVAVILCALPVVAAAQPGGIAARNYSLGVDGITSDIGDRHALFGEARFPIADYVGMFASAELSRFEGEDRYLEATTVAGTIGALVRNSNFGALEASYTYGDSDQKPLYQEPSVSGFFGPSAREFKSTREGYSLAGRLFIKKVDLEVTLSDWNSELDLAEDEYTSSRYLDFDIHLIFAASYYFGDNFSMSANSTESDSWGISATYQPAGFVGALGITGGYSTKSLNDAYQLSLVYHFGTKVSLIDRSRRY